MAQPAFDLIIRGGDVIDGSGAPARRADVAVRGDRIIEVGAVDAAGREEIDASGRLVTPGFVDIHTHYDGQVIWDQRLQPSSWHGVTTVVTGNCGVGFAPCRPEDRPKLVRLMEGVEDIPEIVMTEGLSWNWETYPEYLDRVDDRTFDLDVACQIAHAPLRVYVMGDRALRREPATTEDIAVMARLARDAVEAGALGFSTSRTINHKDSQGNPTPTLTAAEDELTGIAMGLASAFSGCGGGVLQLVSDFDGDPRAEFAMLRRIVEKSGRPLSFSLLQHHHAPDGWRILLDEVHQAQHDGLPIMVQVSPRAVGLLYGLGLTLNPFILHPSYQALQSLTPASRLECLRDPAWRERLLSERPKPDHPLSARVEDWGHIYLLDHDQPDYEPDHDQTVEAIALALGRPPSVVALDHMLGSDGAGLLYSPFQTYGYGSLAASYDMLSDPFSVMGLSDGGAHMGLICDASFPTSALTHWTRDRTRGPRLPLEYMVKKQTADTAALVGLHDRGRLEPGLRADLNVIDYAALRLRAPEISFDLPASGRRLVQRAEGYVATVVAGQVTYRGGSQTGALPGRLIRGKQNSA